MADLARVSRPLLRNAVTAPRFAVPRSLPLPILVNAIAKRHAGMAARPKKQTWAQAHQTASQQKEMEDMSTTMLLPMTLVAPPFRRYPKSPGEFLGMAWLHLRNRVSSLAAFLGVKIVSMPGFFSRPQFKFGRSACVPTAKALHIQLSEAFAAGDLETLKHLCTSEYYLDFAKAIASRPPNRTYSWELVKYNQRLTYPQLADWRTAQTPSGQILKQAVVSIASTQRVAQYVGGKVVPGTEKERQLVENLVLQAKVDNKTYKSTPWKIWGKLPESTYQQYKQDKELMESLQ